MSTTEYTSVAERQNGPDQQDPGWMRVEIRRHRMIMDPDADGRVAVAYDVLVPEEDSLPGAQGVIRLCGEKLRPYRAYEDATWTSDLPRGVDRYIAWLEHERRAQRTMLRMVQAHCPETRGWTKWPVFWAFVDSAAALETIHLRVPITTTKAPGSRPGPAADATGTLKHPVGRPAAPRLAGGDPRGQGDGRHACTNGTETAPARRGRSAGAPRATAGTLRGRRLPAKEA